MAGLLPGVVPFWPAMVVALIIIVAVSGIALAIMMIGPAIDFAGSGEML